MKCASEISIVANKRFNDFSMVDTTRKIGGTGLSIRWLCFVILFACGRKHTRGAGRAVFFGGNSLFLLLLAAMVGCEEAKPTTSPGKSKLNIEDLLGKSETPAQSSIEANEIESSFRFSTVVDSGISFNHTSGNSDELRPFPAANGSGVGVVDFDLDGFQDLLFANGTTFPVNVGTSKFTDAMFRNLGNFQFQEVSGSSGTAYPGYSTGVAVGDFNSDGFPDVYISCYGENKFYLNQGDGTFSDWTFKSGTGDQRWGTSCVFFDYDNDGLLDLYVGNYGIWDLEINKFCRGTAANERIFCSPMSVEPADDVLFRNNGDGSFADHSKQTGIDRRVSRTQGVLAGDFDNNGTTDLYLGNDMHANSFFVNSGEGSFKDMTDASGMGYDADGRSQAGMGLAAADVDNDGTVEVFVTNYALESNAFYQLVRKDGYADNSASRGLAADSFQWVGWGTAFVDIDLDRWPDLIVTNGHTDHNKPNEDYEQPAMLWRNDKERFTRVSGKAGEYFGRPHVGRGLAYADLDNDGDWDLVFANLGQPPGIVRNDTPHSLGWTIQLEGTTCNRDAIGTKVGVQTAAGTQTLQIFGGGSYLSRSDSRLIVPHSEGSVEVTVRWTDGQKTSFSLEGRLPSGKTINIRQ